MRVSDYLATYGPNRHCQPNALACECGRFATHAGFAPGHFESPHDTPYATLHYFEGLSHVEFAEALEISAVTVKSRLSYGLGWLRRAVRKG